MILLADYSAAFLSSFFHFEAPYGLSYSQACEPSIR